MVAYSFKDRFAEAIREGWKTQTIRGRRDRHARPGEKISLYTGMRTKQCRKIADAICTEVMKITLMFDQDGVIDRIVTDDVPVRDLDAFAARDGFVDVDDMSAFWRTEHGPVGVFHGVLIEWAAPRDVGTGDGDGRAPDAGER